MAVDSPNRCLLDNLGDDLLSRILSLVPPPVPRKIAQEVWNAIDPALNIRFCEFTSSSVPSPPRNADAAVSLFNASVCARWRRLAKEIVTTLAVRGRPPLMRQEDLMAAVSCFPKLTNLHLPDCRFSCPLDDQFLCHVASSCPQLKVLDIGQAAYHPITTAGLDELFQRCSGLEHLSFLIPPNPGDLPPSFYELRQLRSLLLTHSAALDNPDFLNLSSLTALTVACPWRFDHLSTLAQFSQLAHLAFRSKFQDSQPSSNPDIVLASSLQSLKFREGCPPFDLLFPLGSSYPRLEVLYLSECQQLQRLPDYMAESLPCLRRLTLCSCKDLLELPDDFAFLPRLETLDISCCPLLDALPQNIGRLSALKALMLSELPFTDLPESICELSSLQALSLSFCMQMSTLPARFWRLTALKSLTVSHMSQLLLPDDLGALPSLQVFHLHENDQELLPASFTRLSSLTDLELSFCEIRELPAGMQHLQNLREVRIFDCWKLRALPGSFTALTSLQSFKFAVEKMEWIPEGAHVRLSSIPRRWNNLRRLKELCLIDCQLLRRSPDSLPKSLEALQLGHESRVTVILAFSKLPNLTSLTLSMPDLRGSPAAVPSCFPQLKRLRLVLADDAVRLPFPLSFPQLLSLEIWARSLKELPRDIGLKLPKIQQLLVRDNQRLEAVPESVTQLRDLEVLEIRALGSPMSSVPDGIKALPCLRKALVEGSGGMLLRVPASASRLDIF